MPPPKHLGGFLVSMSVDRQAKALSQPEYLEMLERHHKIVEDAMNRLNMTEDDLIEYLK